MFSQTNRTDPRCKVHNNVYIASVVISEFRYYLVNYYNYFVTVVLNELCYYLVNYCNYLVAFVLYCNYLVSLH